MFRSVWLMQFIRQTFKKKVRTQGPHFLILQDLYSGLLFSWHKIIIIACRYVQLAGCIHFYFDLSIQKHFR